jgi:hypothetical protein
MNSYGMLIDLMIKTLFHMQPGANITFSIGAQFLIPKSRILCRPKEFYQMIYDILYQKNPLEVATEKTGCLITPWSLERIWQILFDPSISHRSCIADDLMIK